MPAGTAAAVAMTATVSRTCAGRLASLMSSSLPRRLLRHMVMLQVRRFGMHGQLCCVGPARDSRAGCSRLPPPPSILSSFLPHVLLSADPVEGLQPGSASASAGPLEIQDLPLWRVQWAALPGSREVLHVQ